MFMNINQIWKCLSCNIHMPCPTAGNGHLLLGWLFYYSCWTNFAIDHTWTNVWTFSILLLETFCPANITNFYYQINGYTLHSSSQIIESGIYIYIYLYAINLVIQPFVHSFIRPSLPPSLLCSVHLLSSFLLS